MRIQHEWALDQLNPRDFPEIETGYRVAALVREVNDLRRRLWFAEKMSERLKA